AGSLGRVLDDELERLAVAVRALSDDALRGEVCDHGLAAPLLALVDVREVDLDERDGQQLERVPDRIRVVRPGPRVRDDAVGPVERVVAPLDVFALVVRLPAAYVAAELGGPLVDPRLEVAERDAAVELRVAPPEHVEIDPVEHDDLHAGTLVGRLL